MDANKSWLITVMFEKFKQIFIRSAAKLRFKDFVGFHAKIVFLKNSWPNMANQTNQFQNPTKNNDSLKKNEYYYSRITIIGNLRHTSSFTFFGNPN